MVPRQNQNAPLRHKYLHPTPPKTGFSKHVYRFCLNKHLKQKKSQKHKTQKQTNTQNTKTTKTQKHILLCSCFVIVAVLLKLFVKTVFWGWGVVTYALSTGGIRIHFGSIHFG